MTLSYDEIFSSFLLKVDDVEIGRMDEDEATDLLIEFLHSAFSNVYLNKLVKSVEFDDDLRTLELELKEAKDDALELEFVKTILSDIMTLVWLEPKVKRTSLLHQMIRSSSEGKFFSQSAHLSELKDLYHNTELSIKKKIRDRKYIMEVGGNEV